MRKNTVVLFFLLLSFGIFFFPEMLNAQSDRYTRISKLNSGYWVKIRISESGIYQISYADLRAWGFVDPAKVKLYGYGGAMLPEDFQKPYIDDLHERAGSKHVLHLHGELKKVRSSKNPDSIYDLKGWELKPGTRCEDGSLLRPHVVFFGEAVPNIEPATDLVRQADIFVIIGTSLAVYPAASLLHYAPEGIPVFVIDPKIPQQAHRMGYHLIEKGASEGVQELKNFRFGPAMEGNKLIADTGEEFGFQYVSMRRGNHLTVQLRDHREKSCQQLKLADLPIFREFDVVIWTSGESLQGFAPVCGNKFELAVFLQNLEDYDAPDDYRWSRTKAEMASLAKFLYKNNPNKTKSILDDLD